jgi:hypothetical protein
MPKFKYLHREEGRTYVCFDLTGEYSLHHELPPGAIRYVIEGPAQLKDTGADTIPCTINHGGGGPDFESFADLPKEFYLEPGDEVRVEANGDLAILKQTPPVVPGPAGKRGKRAE